MSRYGSRHSVSDRALMEIESQRAREIEELRSQVATLTTERDELLVQRNRHRLMALNGAAAIVTLAAERDALAAADGEPVAISDERIGELAREHMDCSGGAFNFARALLAEAHGPVRDFAPAHIVEADASPTERDSRKDAP
jgi:hypothetical protein